MNAVTMLQQSSGVVYNTTSDIVINGVKQNGWNAIMKTKNGRESLVNITRDRYKLIAPTDFAKAFDEFVGVEPTKVGFYGNQMLITFDADSRYFGDGDKVKFSGVVKTGFDGKNGNGLGVISFRVFCQNQFPRILPTLGKKFDGSEGSLYRGKHTKEGNESFFEWLKWAKRITIKNVDMLSDFFGKLKGKTISVYDAEDLVRMAYPLPQMQTDVPENLREKYTVKWENLYNSVSEIQDGIMDYYLNTGTKIDQGTAWGLFNATTEYFNHGGRLNKNRESSVLLGQRATQMQRMADVLMENI